MGEGFGPPIEHVTQDQYDRSYWTPERISSNIATFLEKLEGNEERARAELDTLLGEAFKEKEARAAADRAIVKRELEELEEQQREKRKNDLAETDQQRHFRNTIEWMVEQGPSSAQDLALNFLRSTTIQKQKE